jgi:hypothetical protein
MHDGTVPPKRETGDPFQLRGLEAQFLQQLQRRVLAIAPHDNVKARTPSQALLWSQRELQPAANGDDLRVNLLDHFKASKGVRDIAGHRAGYADAAGLPISDLIGQPIPTDFQRIAVQDVNLDAVLLEKAGKGGHAHGR